MTRGGYPNGGYPIGGYPSGRMDGVPEEIITQGTNPMELTQSRCRNWLISYFSTVITGSVAFLASPHRSFPHQFLQRQCLLPCRADPQPPVHASHPQKSA